jgi:hypothetical protein
MIIYFFPTKTLCIFVVFFGSKTNGKNIPQNNTLGETPGVHTRPLWLCLRGSPLGAHKGDAKCTSTNECGAFSSTSPSRLELCKLWVSLSNWFGKEEKLTIQK